MCQNYKPVPLKEKSGITHQNIYIFKTSPLFFPWYLDLKQIKVLNLK